MLDQERDTNRTGIRSQGAPFDGYRAYACLVGDLVVGNSATTPHLPASQQAVSAQARSTPRRPRSGAPGSNQYPATPTALQGDTEAESSACAFLDAVAEATRTGVTASAAVARQLPSAGRAEVTITFALRWPLACDFAIEYSVYAEPSPTVGCRFESGQGHRHPSSQVRRAMDGPGARSSPSSQGARARRPNTASCSTACPPGWLS